jgi:hypothetical protein
MSIVIATRGPKNGQCNICGEDGPLTEDHTPPKGCYKPTQVELQSLLRRISAHPTKEGKSRHSQNGVKFRTLCKRCNNSLLGATYDPPFIEFVNQVAQVLRSSISLPRVLPIPAQPQAILRSVLGHMAAQGVARYKKGPLTESVRDYFLDTTHPLPAGLKVFYWAHPHRSHVMVRDAAYFDFRHQKPFAFWLLKFFPIAFLVAWDDPGNLPFPVQALHEWGDLPYEAEVSLPLALEPLPPELWPEAPTDTGMIAYGPEAMEVRPPSASKQALARLGLVGPDD